MSIPNTEVLGNNNDITTMQFVTEIAKMTKA